MKHVCQTRSGLCRHTISQHPLSTCSGGSQQVAHLPVSAAPCVHPCINLSANMCWTPKLAAHEIMSDTESWRCNLHSTQYDTSDICRWLCWTAESHAVEPGVHGQV